MKNPSLEKKVHDFFDYKDEKNPSQKPTYEQAKEAVKTIIEWIGEDPDREGLKETPKRVLASYKEFFAGYEQNPEEILNKTFSETQSYDDIISLSNIELNSFCEHHMVPIKAVAHIAYIPNQKVVGISKLARVAEVYAKRLQLQERLTSQIADAIEKSLKPKGVAVLIEAEHSCMTTRGVNKKGAKMITKKMTGEFKENIHKREDFFRLIKK